MYPSDYSSKKLKISFDNFEFGIHTAAGSEL